MWTNNDSRIIAVDIRNAIEDSCVMLLTKHEKVTFQNQTVYISGQAFLNCSFIDCTLILRETIYFLQDCTFDRCNWHVDWVLMWGSPESIVQLKALVDRIEQAQVALGDQLKESEAQVDDKGNPTSPFAG